MYDLDYSQGTMTYTSTVGLCYTCHAFIHAGRIQHLMDKGEMSQSKAKEIFDWGNMILKNACEANPELMDMAPDYEEDERLALLAGIEWNDWRLVIGEDEYPPKLKSLEEWMEYHNGKDLTSS